MRRAFLLLSGILSGCLLTTTHRIEMKRQANDLWWREPQRGSAAVVSSSCLGDEQFFESNVIRWPEDWKKRHPHNSQPVRPKLKKEVFESEEF